jgi:hypothetical protein
VAFGFDPRGTDVPLAIRLGQGVRGGKDGALRSSAGEGMGHEGETQGRR